MAFSATNDYEGFGEKNENSSGSEAEGETTLDRGSKEDKSALKGSTIHVLETERYLKAKEVEFMNTI